MLGQKSRLLLPKTLLKTDLFRRYISSDTSEWLLLYLYLLLSGTILVKT